MDLGLSGLTAVVTGGTKGIGRAIADTLDYLADNLKARAEQLAASQ